MIFIQESWLRKCDQAILKEIKEYGFDVLSYRKSVKLDFGCGVATIFKKNLQVKQLHLPKQNSFEFVASKVLTEQGSVCIVNVYRPGYNK